MRAWQALARVLRPPHQIYRPRLTRSRGTSILLARGLATMKAAPAETLSFDYWRQHKLQSSSSYLQYLRPAMHPKTVVWSRIHVQALMGEDITVYGGAQTRSFCYVDDLFDGLFG